jgi:hypothetical protein
MNRTPDPTLPVAILALCVDAVFYAVRGLGPWWVLFWLALAFGTYWYSRWLEAANAKIPSYKPRRKRP